MFAEFFNRRGGPVFLWGLFLLSAAAASPSGLGLGLGGQGGILLYRDDGQITFWSGGASYSRGASFESGLSVVKTGSDMPWLSTGISSVGYSAGLNFKTVRPKVAAGLISASETKILWGDAVVKSDGAGGFYAGASLGVDARGVEIEPSFIFAKARFGPGDFYTFYGKPDIRAFIHAGLSAEYEKKHKAGFTYDAMSLDIRGNTDSLLFESGNYCAGAYYKYTFAPPRKPFDFYVVSGVNYALFSIGGALTAANQQYTLFPYAFYDVTGGTEAVIGYAGGSVGVAGKYFSHSLTAGAGNVFGGKLRADARYRHRKFYGDDEATEELVNINLAGTGIVFSAYSIETRRLIIGDRFNVYFGLRKILGYYWGMDKFADIGKPKEPSGGEPGEPGEPAAASPEVVDWGSLIKTVLFSGLSGELRVNF
ncbi:MAG: hypothetical protein LBB74_09710 [Chitinispirillales bacterium]|jgi:hypothetical protein|nr:hypothetical protein [Chitinispirillales bacterium]